MLDCQPGWEAKHLGWQVEMAGLISGYQDVQDYAKAAAGDWGCSLERGMIAGDRMAENELEITGAAFLG